MSAALTIVGGVLQAIGLAFVFAELVIIRSYELGIPTPWAKASEKIKRLLRRPTRREQGWGSSFGVSDSARAKVRPGDLAADASESERIARLERYVELLDRDLEQLHDTIDRKADQLAKAAKQGEQTLRDEIGRREKQRREALVLPSLKRQAVGAAFVFVGLGLATWGGAISTRETTDTPPTPKARSSPTTTPSASHAGSAGAF